LGFISIEVTGFLDLLGLVAQFGNEVTINSNNMIGDKNIFIYN
jgi:hypothetical protein